MRLAEIAVGAHVAVRRGYSVRPAVVESISGGYVHVHFTDVTAADLASIPEGHRSYMLGASVRPNQIERVKCAAMVHGRHNVGVLGRGRDSFRTETHRCTRDAIDGSPLCAQHTKIAAHQAAEIARRNDR